MWGEWVCCTESTQSVPTPRPPTKSNLSLPPVKINTPRAEREIAQAAPTGFTTTSPMMTRVITPPKLEMQRRKNPYEGGPWKKSAGGCDFGEFGSSSFLGISGENWGARPGETKPYTLTMPRAVGSESLLHMICRNKSTNYMPFGPSPDGPWGPWGSSGGCCSAIDSDIDLTIVSGNHRTFPN